MSQISEKPSLLTNRSEQLLSARPLRKLDVEALLSDISARSDTSLPRSSKKVGHVENGVILRGTVFTGAVITCFKHKNKNNEKQQPQNKQNFRLK